MPKMSLSIFDKEFPKVLIADDNDFNRLLLGNILKNHGIPFIEATNGKIAVKNIEKFDRKKTPILCIIMDCDMPVMNGWEASKAINEKYNKGFLKYRPAIIGHTAYSSTADINQCYDSGMITYILKPASQAQILHTLKKYI